MYIYINDIIYIYIHIHTVSNDVATCPDPMSPPGLFRFVNCMGVSQNGDTPRSSILTVHFDYKASICGDPHFGKPPYVYTYIIIYHISYIICVYIYIYMYIHNMMWLLVQIQTAGAGTRGPLPQSRGQR